MNEAPAALERPYLLFLGDAHDELAAKTARGVAHWRPEWCVGQWRLPGCQPTLGLPDLRPAEAAARGAKTMIIGVANAGGVLPDSWVPSLLEALEAGLDLANGLHARLSRLPAVVERAAQLGRQLHDVRRPHRNYPLGKGRRRTGRRLLTVGTDCSVGKMYAALALEREMRARGLTADFRATGQTGILISGSGVPVDAVAADFIAGSVEWLTPDAAPDHWDLVEGQGSLYHPSFAGVSLGLTHGACPDALVLCHDPARRHMRGLPDYPVPALRACLEANLMAARLVNPEVRLLGGAIITAGLDAVARLEALRRAEDELGVPCVDPLATGVGPIVDRLQSEFQ